MFSCIKAKFPRIFVMLAAVLALSVAASGVALLSGAVSAPHAASAQSTAALSTVEHISWDPSSIDSGGGTTVSFTAELKGTHFPIADTEPIEWQVDALLDFGSSESACAAVSHPKAFDDPDGNWLITVSFTDCHTHNRIVASAVDDGHLNHATLTIN